MKTKKKQDADAGEFDLNAFKTKHFAHFSFRGHVLQCQCQPDHRDGCPFKQYFEARVAIPESTDGF